MFSNAICSGMQVPSTCFGAILEQENFYFGAENFGFGAGKIEFWSKRIKKMWKLKGKNAKYLLNKSKKKNSVYR